MNERHRRVGWFAATATALLVVRIYPVTETVCGRSHAPGSGDCSTQWVVHAPLTVVLNGFSYGEAALSRGVLDASVTYSAPVLPALVLGGAVVAAWPLAGRLSSRPSPGLPGRFRRRVANVPPNRPVLVFGLLSVVPALVGGRVGGEAVIRGVPLVGGSVLVGSELLELALLPFVLLSLAFASVPRLLVAAPLGVLWHPVGAVLGVGAGSGPSAPLWRALLLVGVEAGCWYLVALLVSVARRALGDRVHGAGRPRS